MAPQNRPTGLSPLRRERLYESLAAHISDFIEAQGLVPGDRLPPERRLAAELGVSRATLSQALAALETRGRIQVRHGVGAVVRDPGAPASVGARFAEHPVEEIAVAREAVLAGIARAAAANPAASLRLAMLADDGRPRSWDATWRCMRKLAAEAVLADLDDMLAQHTPAPPDSARLRAGLAEIADAVIRGDGSASATACSGLLAAGGSPHGA